MCVCVVELLTLYYGLALNKTKEKRALRAMAVVAFDWAPFLFWGSFFFFGSLTEKGKAMGQ